MQTPKIAQHSYRIIPRDLRKLSFLKSHIIFCADLCISVCVSLISYLVIVSAQANEPVATLTLLGIGLSSFVSSIALLLLFRLHREIIRYTSTTGIWKIISIACLKAFCIVTFVTLIGQSIGDSYKEAAHFAIFDLLLTTFLLMSIRMLMISVYHSLIKHDKPKAGNCFICGTSDHTAALTQQFKSSSHSKYIIVGLLSRNDAKVGHYICGTRIYSPRQNRKEVEVDSKAIECEIRGQAIMVTGAAGSIGSEISRQAAQLGARQLILIDCAETAMHHIRLEFEKSYPDTAIEYKIGDIRDDKRIGSLIAHFRPSIIFHAAAYKHVPMMEANPRESIRTNVGGSVNIAKHALLCKVKKFIMISTDQAVNPTNIMGATKRLAEMYIQSLNGEGHTEFITTRFGNVLGSNGSVIPHFEKQIHEGGPVTVTHPDIIRYFMTIPDACRLVLQAATIGKSGEILVFDMGRPERILDLARKMIRSSGYEPETEIDIVFTGLRPGEKLDEELLTSDEETQATQHSKIRIAQSSNHDAEHLIQNIDQLLYNASNCSIDEIIILLKKIVPEFIRIDGENPYTKIAA